MKKHALFLSLLMSVFFLAFPRAEGQILRPATWSYALDSTQQQEGFVDLVFYAHIDTGWYLYATDFDPDLGPVPTIFTLEEDPSYTLVGGIRPIGAQKKYDEIWEGEFTFFKKKGEFRQTLRVHTFPPVLKGIIASQVCTEADGRCILLEEDFTWASFLKGTNALQPERTAPADGASNVFDNVFDNAFDNVADKAPDSLSDNGEISLVPEEGTASAQSSLWLFMVLAFLAGLAALFTPCVFPLVPMTVTYFTDRKEQGKTKALLYGLFIVLIYTLLGLLVAPFMGPEVANELATGWFFNLLFFAVFVLFGLSFLGMFDIVLPHRWVNFTDSHAEGKGWLGVFFMALTLVLVTFSCTGPIIGSILVESAGGLAIKPVVGMFGYSIAFALPFSLFALFPKWLSALPKSGGWLNTVKVTLGFLELAFALKFLSIADQAYHWGLLDREVYLGLWIAIFTTLGIYLLGKIQLPKDAALNVLSVPRLVFAILSFAFVIYLIPGMFGAPLRALAGYLPPPSTQDFDLHASTTFSANSASSSAEALCNTPMHADFLTLPHGIQGYFDYEEALACARRKKKPLFIDFTGHGCVNCREMEARVWSHPEVLTRLKRDFIIVALYIDERKELPSSRWYRSSYDQKIKKTIGRQNADLQITRFQNNAQPYYVILGPDEALLVPPKAYDLDPKNFIDFLDKAKKRFEEKHATAASPLSPLDTLRPLIP